MITIVILLILLAVSIDLVIDGKIFKSAEKAVNGTNEKVAQQNLTSPIKSSIIIKVVPNIGQS